MTPKKPRVANSTRLKIERKSMPTAGTPSNGDTPKTKVHVAGGTYAGIVINKMQDGDDSGGE